MIYAMVKRNNAYNHKTKKASCVIQRDLFNSKMKSHSMVREKPLEVSETKLDMEMKTLYCVKLTNTHPDLSEGHYVVEEICTEYPYYIQSEGTVRLGCYVFSPTSHLIVNVWETGKAKPYKLYVDIKHEFKFRNKGFRKADLLENVNYLTERKWLNLKSKEESKYAERNK